MCLDVVSRPANPASEQAESIGTEKQTDKRPPLAVDGHEYRHERRKQEQNRNELQFGSMPQEEIFDSVERPPPEAGALVTGRDYLGAFGSARHHGHARTERDAIKG